MSARAMGLGAAVLCAVLAAPGCGTRRTSDTARTATEQLLVSAAIEQAVAQLQWGHLTGRCVFIDDTLVDRVDKTFLIAEVRAAARQAGVLVVNERDEARYVVELRAGAVGTDRNEYLLGIPASQVPIPGGGPVATPEVPTYKSVTQTAACHVGYVAYAREDGRYHCASGPAYGYSDHKSVWVLGAGPSIQTNMAPAKTPPNTTATVPAPAQDKPADQ